MPRPRDVEASSERIVSRKDSSSKKSKTPVAVVTAKRVVVSGKTPRKMPKAAAVRAEIAKKEKKERPRMVDDEAEEADEAEEREAPKKTKKRAAPSSDAEEEENEAPVKPAKKSKKPASKDDKDDEATADEGEREGKEKKKRAKPRFKKHTMHVREMKFLQEIPNEQLLKSKTAHRRARQVANGDYRFTRDAVTRIAEIAVGMSKLDICRARALNQFVSIHDGTGMANPGPLRASALSMAHLLASH